MSTRGGVLFLAIAALLLAAPAAGRTFLDGTAPTVKVPGEITVAATSSAGASVAFLSFVSASDSDGGPLTPSCSPESGSFFLLGSTEVTCTAEDAAGNRGSNSFLITVKDMTAPAVSVPSVPPTEATAPANTAVSYPDATATDDVDGSVAAACTPPSGSGFSVGPTSVNCTATDAAGNSATASFTVTVTDTTAPVLGALPGDQTVEATSSGGAVVVYTPPSAADNGDPAPAVTCTPASGSTFGLGSAPVSCTARDASGNVSGASSFTVTVRDTTPPVLSLPSNITVEADTSTGKAVTYVASASDVVAGAVAVDCSPAPGSTFRLGTTTVNCSASDGTNPAATGSFTVTVTDTSGPTFSSLSTDKVVEANGPSGSIVNYSAATAVDGVDGPIASSPCSPASGSLFPLGTTEVTCTATDASSNVARASFRVSVLDRTPPALIAPPNSTGYANTPAGLNADGDGLRQFLGGARATDLVDPNPRISNDAGEFFAVGVHTVTFTATDASGNVASKTAVFEVLPVPPAGTPPAPIPPPRKLPPNVANLKAVPGDNRVELSWRVPNGVDHVVLTRALTAGGDVQQLYSGSGASFVDRAVANGLEYRYVVVSVDGDGNESSGVATVALPKRSLLRSPKDGARLKKPPKLTWVKNSEATYYNVQLFSGEKKILSIWPVRPSLTLTRTWRYGGRGYRLTRGAYTWYVWPGFGARSAVDYGELLGSRSFQITR